MFLGAASLLSGLWTTEYSQQRVVIFLIGMYFLVIDTQDQDSDEEKRKLKEVEKEIPPQKIIPHKLTFVVDYGLFFGYIYFYNKVCDYYPDEWTTGFLVLMTFSFFLVLDLRERFFFLVLDDTHIPKAKRDLVYSWKNIGTIVTAYACVCLELAFLHKYDLLHTGKATFDYDPRTGFAAWVVQAQAALALADFVIMGPIHEFMHSYGPLYKYHKVHHCFTNNLSLWGTYHMHFVDWIFEGFSPPILLLFLQWWFGTDSGMQVHFICAMRFNWIDCLGHSCNPYSCPTLNPIMEYFIKSNVSHSLHHAKNSAEHATRMPFHHLDWRKRWVDVKDYNKRMKTNIIY